MSPIPSTLLLAAGAAIVGTLGTAHLVLTFWGPKLLPRDRSVREAMEGCSLVITDQTTYWRAWIGFNASHSLGAILFAAVYGYLALFHVEFLQQSRFLLGLGVATLLSYVALAQRYWFITPLIGTSSALALFLAGILLG